MPYIPLHHKYRPQTFADLVGQSAIATTLTNALTANRIAPAYLFTGPRGTGKTSSARILAKSLNCLNSSAPTATPCGECDVCQSIALGAALDVIEIDAASNTGVDNIREIIERAQYAPVQCRYKVYTIDECLTGDTLVSTSTGCMRIDNPALRGRKVLSYNESIGRWEYKQVRRWLDRGENDVLTISTNNRQIRCTANHLIRTDRGWLPAKDLMPGMKILSPVNAGAAVSSTNSAQMESLVGSCAVINSKEIPTGKKVTIESKSYNKQNYCDLSVVVAANNSTTFTWVLTPPENSWQISSITLSPQWTTNLETIESVCPAGRERVYDLEVDDNHNFVANGLLVHNCHMLSTAAFNSLLKTLEEPPPHVVFILATTDPQRVLPTIISRCQRFDYRRIGVTDMVEHLSYIAEAENIAIEPAAILPIAQLSQGGLRDAESLLDRLSLLDGEITPERVWEISGAVGERDLLDILKAIASNNPEQLLDRLRGLLARGKEPLTILQSLAGCYRDLAIAKTAPNRQDLVIFTAEGWQELCEIATEWQLSAILSGQVALKESESQLKQTTQPYLWLEVSCLGLFPTAQIAPVAPPSHSPTPPPSHTPTPPPAHSSTPPPSQPLSPTNLAEIWQQTLDRLPKSSQSLLAQYGSPIDITTEQAIVGLKTNTFLRIAEGKIPELAKAFGEVLGRSIQVKLTLASAAPSPTPTLPQPSTPPLPPSPTPTVSHAPATRAEPDEYLSDDDEIADDEEPEPVARLEPVAPAPSIEPAVEPPKFEFQPAIAPELPVALTPTDIALQAATDRLIQLFDGEIADDLDRYSGTDDRG